MSDREVDEAIDASDYFRLLLRQPEMAGEAGARLVQLKLVAHLLDSLQRHMPRTAIALCSLTNARRLILDYGRQGGYEAAYEQALPHAIRFVGYLLETDAPLWCKDLARVELWLDFCTADAPQLAAAKAICRAEDHRDGISYLTVGSDIPALIQSVDGYTSTSISDTARLLWLLGFEPVRLLVETRERPGIALFQPGGEGEGASLRYIAEDE